MKNRVSSESFVILLGETQLRYKNHSRWQDAWQELPDAFSNVSYSTVSIEESSIGVCAESLIQIDDFLTHVIDLRSILIFGDSEEGFESVAQVVDQIVCAFFKVSWHFGIAGGDQE